MRLQLRRYSTTAFLGDDQHFLPYVIYSILFVLSNRSSKNVSNKISPQQDYIAEQTVVWFRVETIRRLRLHTTHIHKTRTSRERF